MTKPKSQGMAGQLYPWVARVHAYCLRTGNFLTPAQAIEQFGLPRTNWTAEELMETARLDGYFLRREGAYKALKPEAQPKVEKWDHAASLGRVSSVFDLGRV